MVDEKKDGASEEPEFEIIEQGQAPAHEQGDEPPVEDERLRQSDDDDEEDETSGNDQETPEQRAERRREERRKRKERQRKAEQQSRAELQQLREANDFMARKMQQLEAVALRTEARAVDQRLFEAKNRYDWAERAHAEAIARGDGIGASKALRERDQASHDYREAEAIRGRLMEMGQDPVARPQPQQRGPDPRLVSKAKAFVEKHSWIDPSGMKDEDSAVARALDIKLQADGYDPTTDEYWETLEEKLKQRLPHRFKAAGRASPPVSGGMDRAGSGKKTFFLSPDRKKAIVDAGMWDDPAARNRMIKRYAEYDAQQKTKATR